MFMWCGRLPWGGALLALESAQEELHPDVDQVILCGLAAQVGLAQDPIDSLTPHATTGAADFLHASHATVSCTACLSDDNHAIGCL